MTSIDAYIVFQGIIWNFTYTGSGGIYTVTIGNIPGDVLILPQTLSAVIYINRENYTTSEITITINVGMLEIFPGVPMFWFFMIVGAIVAVVGSIGGYKYIQIRKIPKFIKRNKAIRKAINSKDKISESLIYPSISIFLSSFGYCSINPEIKSPASALLTGTSLPLTLSSPVVEKWISSPFLKFGSSLI